MPCVGHKNNKRINHFLYIIYQNNHIYITTLETVHTSQVSLNILYPSMWQVSCNTVCHSPVKHIQPFYCSGSIIKENAKQHTPRLQTHPFNGSFSGTTQVSRYQKGKTNLDFTEARDSEWQWHQLGHMQVSTLLQTDNHISTPPLSFLQAGCPSCRPTNSVKALKE